MYVNMNMYVCCIALYSVPEVVTCRLVFVQGACILSQNMLHTSALTINNSVCVLHLCTVKKKCGSHKPRKHTHIHVGTCTCTLYIPTFLLQDYHLELVCTTERERFVVPVRAVGVRALLDFPDEIHFPSSPVKVHRL